MTLRTPLCDLLGVEYPIMLAGMGGVAFAEVTAAVSNAGGFGCLGMAGQSVRTIAEQMKMVRDLTDKPFGVDLLTALPEQMDAAVDTIIAGGASVFVSGLGVPGNVIGRFHAAGMKVMSVCGTVAHAVNSDRAGCDAVIAQGTEGGGHTGKIAGMALIPQVVDAVKCPVIAAGSIVDGRGLAVALAFGAQGVWMGTRFIASTEANAGRFYKEALVKAGETDTIISRCYSGKTMRVIRNPYVDDWERRPQDIAPFPQQAIISAQSGVTATLAGSPEEADPARMCMPAGQGTGSIHDIVPAAEIVRRVMAEAEATIGRLGHLRTA